MSIPKKIMIFFIKYKVYIINKIESLYLNNHKREIKLYGSESLYLINVRFVNIYLWLIISHVHDLIIKHGMKIVYGVKSINGKVVFIIVRLKYGIQ